MPAISAKIISDTASANLLLGMSTLVRRAGVLGNTSSGGISSTAIVLIVCVGIVPVFLIAGVVIWALFFYGADRACCCSGKHKREKKLRKNRDSIGSASTVFDEASTGSLPKQPEQAVRSASSFFSRRWSDESAKSREKDLPPSPQIPQRFV